MECNLGYNVSVVIGANFGDEGKGYVSNALCANSIGETLTILPTGGSQRAHTVDCNNKLYTGRHVYHHFASGTMNKSHTYYGCDFVMNPMEFMRESRELGSLCPGWNLHCNLYANPRCSVTTPFDMLFNQIKEESRGEGKHGTCGYGVWETIKRNWNEPYKYGFTFEELCKYFDGDFLSNKGILPLRQKLIEIRDGYYRDEIRRHGINLTDEWKKLFYSDKLIQHWIMDAKQMCWLVQCCELTVAMKLVNPSNVIFEFGQGILLDCDNLEYAPHLTCAKTGLDGINQLHNVDYKYIIHNADSFKVYYVTRTYLTRHGVGRLDRECARDAISNNMMEDKTNVPNPFQNHLRYAPMDYDALIKRIVADCKPYNCRVNIVFTHCNELSVRLGKLKDAVNKYFEDNVHIYEQFAEGESFENLKNYFLKPLDKF